MCKILKREIFDDVAYYQWLQELVWADREPYDEYVMLISSLHKMPYRWVSENDKNRASDGIKMRELFVETEGYDVEDIPDRPCSVFEMLVGFANRIERDIMGVPGNDHPELWFWIMIKNLGLDVCVDKAYNESYFRQQVEGWMDQKPKIYPKYSPFPVKQQFRYGQKMELWRAMNLYLNANF